ncbi:MAG: NapC/NirT family cytochrome c [Candidatus Methanoperedens sp.]|nr:NapC/NirT family cytochrome c [Candidatus Methanoperedens sp.]MCZ7406034.1 NapC/NirT family cytochrome c [Candidatus Methanoperedens sp.]
MALRKIISITSLAILAIVIIVGGVGVQLVTTQPVFCNSCHEMNFYYNTWQNSTHGPKAVCLNCHSEPGLNGFIGEKVRGAEQVVAHFSGNFTVPIQIVRRVKNDQCLACHPETRNLTDKTIEAKHALHMDKSVLCADCHSRLVHNQSGQPRVITLAQCDLCHKAHTNFKLVGVHATLSCEKCHPGDKYNGTSPNCESCHKVPANHIPGITGNCDKCHTTAGWKPATFDHSKFPLTGKHQSLTCDQCHHGVYNGTSSVCVNCHKVPANHVAGIVSNCEKCHTTAGWKPATFDHSTFALTGKHASLACDQCHHGSYTGTAAGCVDCHQPPSTHAGMSTDCAQCHTPDGFTPANFVHQRVGEHIGGRGERPLSCVTCHPVQFTETSCTGSRCHSSNNPGGGGRGGGDD